MKDGTFQGMQYTVRYPKDFDETKKYPLLLFLHGAGTRGNNLGALKGNAFFKETEKYEDFPFVVAAPLCSENTWFDMMETLKAWIKETAALPYVDASRVYLMGNSMGGYATWQLAMSMPELFAAIVPICGGGMYWNAGRLASVPVWAFHGEKDPVVYVEESKKMTAAVNAQGGSARLTLYPENGHDAWTDTYRNREVFEWLLSHSKRASALGEDGFLNREKFG